MPVTLTPPPMPALDTSDLIVIRSTTLTVFADCDRPELRHVTVLESRDELTLIGTVSTFYLKQLAQESVRGTAAGRRIRNRVQVG